MRIEGNVACQPAARCTLPFLGQLEAEDVHDKCGNFDDDDDDDDGSGGLFDRATKPLTSSLIFIDCAFNAKQKEAGKERERGVEGTERQSLDTAAGHASLIDQPTRLILNRICIC